MRTKGKRSTSILMAVVMTLLTFTTVMVPTIAGAAVTDLQMEHPTPAQILSDINAATAANGAAHPRIMINMAKLNELKEKCITSPVEPYASWYKTLKTSADNNSADSKPLLTMGDLESLAVINRVLILNFVYMMTTDSNLKNGEEKYKTRLYKEITNLSTVDWSALSTQSFLRLSQMLMTFSISYDWLYNSWTDAEKSTIKNLMMAGLKQSEIYYKEIVSGQKSSVAGLISSTHNWNMCSNAGIQIASLTIADEADASELSSWLISEGLKIMENNFQHLTGGTGYIEGTGYTQFLMRYFTMFVSALTSATNKDYGFLTAPGMDKIAYYYPAMIGAQNGSNTLDSSEGPALDAPEPFFFAKIYKDPALASYRVQQVKQPSKNVNVKDLLWYEAPEFYGQTADYNTIFKTSYPKDMYFSNPEDATFRNGFWDADTSYFLLGGGKNNVNHGHIDAGSFFYESQGVTWAIDIGKGNTGAANFWTYSNKTPSRWLYYQVRAEGHNTFVINPNKDPNKPADQNLDNKIPVIQYESTPEKGKAVVDMALAYPDDVNKATRTGEFDKATGEVVLTDDIEFKTASGNKLYWFMHTRAAITIAADGKSATLVQDGKTLEVKVLDSSSVLTQTAAVPFSSTPTPPTANNPNNGITKLAIVNENVGGTYQIKVSMKVKDVPLYPIAAVTPPVNDGTIKVTLNGKPIEFDQQPIIENDRTLVPFRKIFEAMEADVSWDNATQTVTAKKGDIVITLQIGNNIMMKNGQQITLDVPAKLVNDRTLVPVRAIVEGLGAKVDWDGATQTVIITTAQ